VDFILAISGEGARVKFDYKNIQTVPEGLIALFGPLVFHGSPEAEYDRLIIVGTAQDNFF
jgi:hypothetical protein